MHDLSISLFGPPQITRGTQQITVQRRKDLALLVYLVVTAQPHTRDTIATLLWPDSDQSLARANVRKNISRLKNDLGEEVLLTTSDQIKLNPDFSLWLDVKEFQSRLEQPRKHNHPLQQNGQPLCEACQSALQEAVQLYRSPFLEGFSLSDSATFDEWQYFQSEGYRQNLSNALQQLVQQYLYLEQFNPAIEHCRKWLAMDTLNETAHKKLMVAYALSGQQSAALRQFEECSRLLKDELGIDPEPETIELYEAIRDKKIVTAGEPVKAVTTIQKSPEESPNPKTNNNLPITTTPFVGRTRELGEINDLLDEPTCRVVTLLGPGGSGKTRLSIQIGASLLKESKFKDGVWFIQLAPLTDHASIVPNIQKVLNIPPNIGQGNPLQQLFTYLRNRQSLLILDNFEHLLNTESIKLIADLIHHAPQTKVLITSRERLKIQGEYLFPVEGLDTPSDEAVLSAPVTDSKQSAFGAIQLFEQSAQKVQPSFRITRENIRMVAQICQYVQGMPLAIELAAAWIEALSLEEIHKEVKQDLDFLQSELHDIPDRQRSLRAVFDSSWEKLSKPTRSTIKALSVFRSNFSREAAQAITGMSARTLLELTNKSWIQPQKNGKYQIHELLRQFAYHMLQRESVTFEQVKDRYCAYYSIQLAYLWETMKGPGQARFFTELEFEFENIRSAWNWLAERRDYKTVVNDLLPSLFIYSEARGKTFDFIGMVEQILQGLDDSGGGMEIILRTARGAFYSDGGPIREAVFEGLYPINNGEIQHAWSLLESPIELHDLGFWGILLAYFYGCIVDKNTAIEKLQQTIPHFVEKNDAWELAMAKLHLARLSLAPSSPLDPDTHASINHHLAEALETFNLIGDKVDAGHTMRQMGILRMKEQKLEEAIQQWKAAHSILLSADVNEWSAASNIMWQIGDAYLQLGQFDKAFKCFQDISRINLEHGFIQQAIVALSKESFEKARYGDLTEAIQIRQHCLDLIHETGPDYQVAWNVWEMGELLRLSGEIDEAENWFERAHDVFKKYEDKVGQSFYWRGMGDIALARNELNEAAKHFTKSVELGRSAQHNWVTAYSLNGLGKTALKIKDAASAQVRLIEALSLARISHDPGIALSIMATVSGLFVHSGNAEKAVELGNLVLGHFASWNETKRNASEFLSPVRQTILPRKFSELKKKGESLQLWGIVDELIGALQ